MSRRIVTLAILVLALLAFAPPVASAHHANISASVDCTGLVSYTATAWETDDANRRVNNSVTVSIGGATIGSGSFTGQNGYAFGGSHQLSSPLPASVTVGVTWGNFGPTGEYGGAGSDATAALPVPPCPAAPGGSIGDIDCGAGGAIVSLSNTGGLSADISILRDGALIETVSVGGGGSATRTVPIAEDTTSTIALTSGGGTLASRSVSANCTLAPPVPSAAIADVDCGNGGALVTLGNTGEATATFTVTAAPGGTQTVDVVGGSSATRTIAIAENTSATITVTAAGLADVTRTLSRDCSPAPLPVASIGGVQCADGGAYVTVRNNGGEFTTFTIAVDGVTFDTVTVGGGSSAVRLVPIAEGTTSTIDVTAPGMLPQMGSITRSCITPGSAPTPPPAPPTPVSPVGAAPVAVTPAVTEPSVVIIDEPTSADVTEADDDDSLEAVLGVDSVDRPDAARSSAELPFTGSRGIPGVVIAALAAIMLGSFLIADARHRRAPRRADAA